MRPSYFLHIFLSLFFTKLAQCLERELTVNVEPLKETCFYQHVKENEKIDIEYQVIDGGHGDLDITFRLVDPNDRIRVTDIKKSENTHRLDAGVLPGDYRFCFDNTFSTYNTKTVFFELIIEGEGDDEWDDVKGDGMPEEVYEMAVDEIQETINRVHHNLKSVRHLQDAIKSAEARDRNIAEENYFKVNTFSAIQITIMILVGITQVVVMRSLFDEKSRVHVIWKKLLSSR